jgi:hypothetical protein
MLCCYRVIHGADRYCPNRDRGDSDNSSGNDDTIEEGDVIAGDEESNFVQDGLDTMQGAMFVECGKILRNRKKLIEFSRMVSMASSKFCLFVFLMQPDFNRLSDFDKLPLG